MGRVVRGPQLVRLGGMAGADMARTTVSVLGPVTTGIGETTRIPRASHRRLLSLLALDAGEWISTERLIERFWGGEPPGSAKGAMHTHLSALRGLLPPDSLVTEGAGYRLVLAAGRLDVIEFNDAARAARSEFRIGEWREAIRLCELALRTWRGDPFVELTNDGFARPEIARLEELRISVIETRAEALVRLDRAAEALPDLEWAVHRYPLREGLSKLLARAREQTGSHAEALRSLRATVRALAELGLEPSPALRDLEQRILAHPAIHAGPRDAGLERRRSA